MSATINNSSSLKSSKTTDPDDIDPEQYIEHVFDVLAARRRSIRAWFESNSFVDVHVRELPSRGRDAYEVLAIGDADHQWQTNEDVFHLLNQFANSIQKRVSEEEFCAVIWQGFIGAQFRFREP
jgi:hypothetical protein